MNSVPSSELGRAGQIVAGKFRLDAMIGRGGMGSVWSATHVGLGHRVAIKLIAREFVRSTEALRRFDAEAKAAARLQSRHVVQVFDNGMLDDGTPFIAMELLSGENLSDRIAHAGAFSLGVTVDVLAQCCRALGRAHAAGIVHRDIKPDNIFLAQEADSDGEVIKILDFGVAKMTVGMENQSQVTGTGALLGTPLFMSPEQIRGSRDCDHRSDLYSLGLVAYTMLTGQLAVGGDSFGDILVKICTEPLPSLLAAAPGLPYPMEAWFQRACARDAATRCQSAQEFIETLRAAAGAAVPVAPIRDTTTPPLPTLQSAATPGAPPRGGAAFAESAAAVSVTAAGVPKRPIGPWIAVGILAVLFAAGGAVLVAVAPGHHDSSGDPGAAAASAAGASPAASSTSASMGLSSGPGASADAGRAALTVPFRPSGAGSTVAAPAPGPSPSPSPLAASPAAGSPVVALAAAGSPVAASPVIAAAPSNPSTVAPRPVAAVAPAPSPVAQPPVVMRPMPLPRPAATINVGY